MTDIILIVRVSGLEQVGGGKCAIAVRSTGDITYFSGGRFSKAGMPSGKWWNGCASQVNIAACAENTDGSSKVPTFTIIEFGRAGLSVPIAVPQLTQKCLVTGVSRSLLANLFGFPSM